MMIDLPNGKKAESLETLENWLKNKSAFEIQKQNMTQNGKVFVALPKFTFRSSLNLKEPLISVSLFVLLVMKNNQLKPQRNFWVSWILIFMLIFMVSPSLKLRSNDGLGASFSFSISVSFWTHLKWSWRATFKSKLSERSANPTPMNALRPINLFYNIIVHYWYLCQYSVLWFLIK